MAFSWRRNVQGWLSLLPVSQAGELAHGMGTWFVGTASCRRQTCIEVALRGDVCHASLPDFSGEADCAG